MISQTNFGTIRTPDPEFAIFLRVDCISPPPWDIGLSGIQVRDKPNFKM